MSRNYGVILAWTVVVLDAGAGVGYLVSGDWKRAVLWACWSLGTAMTIFMR